MSEIRYAIMVGINDYEVNPLDYCVKDVDDVSKCLINHCNLFEENIFPIRSKYNEPIEDVWLSFEKILKRIEAQFKPGEDSLIFYFSGHGIKGGKSTALSFKGKTVTIQELFNLFSKLNPRFLFFFIDSCYSGIGIADDIGATKDELNFHQNIAVSTGYNIFCASAHDKTAKEDENIKNGRFTRLFIDAINNKINYKNGILSLSKIYFILDETFKNNPQFRQLPFSQNKGLSTYPLAYISESSTSQYYSNHYIKDVETHDWQEVIFDIKTYTSASNDLINELVRLIREILRNSVKWGEATHLQLEITKNSITIIENSGKSFDIFNPPKDALEKARGGITNALSFKEHFSSMFDFLIETNDDFVFYSFQLNEVKDNNPCTLTTGNIGNVRSFLDTLKYSIPNKCQLFTIELSQGRLDLSFSHFLLRGLIEHCENIKIPIVLKISDNDRLKKYFIDDLAVLAKEKTINLTIE